MNFTLEEANEFVNMSIVQSTAWDQATDQQKTKAINNAIYQLKNYYKKDDFNMDVILHQSVWLLRIDDVIARAELGVTHTQVDGINISVSNVDRRLCPEVLCILGKRVGRYTGTRGYIV